MPNPPQNPSPNQPPQPQEHPEVTQEEADEMLASFQRQADEWRKRLADPQVRAQIKAGTLVVSPLIHELLTAFPPASIPPVQKTGSGESPPTSAK
jgi:hypothetical protein